MVADYYPYYFLSFLSCKILVNRSKAAYSFLLVRQLRRAELLFKSFLYSIVVYLPSSFIKDNCLA